MNDEYDLSGYPLELLQRMQAALTELNACLGELHAFRPHVLQMSELLRLWSALPTDASRESALQALRDLRGGVHQ